MNFQFVNKIDDEFKSYVVLEKVNELTSSNTIEDNIMFLFTQKDQYTNDEIKKLISGASQKKIDVLNSLVENKTLLKLKDGRKIIYKIG
jgi:acetolactate synthase small subunit